MALMDLKFVSSCFISSHINDLQTVANLDYREPLFNLHNCLNKARQHATLVRHHLEQGRRFSSWLGWGQNLHNCRRRRRGGGGLGEGIPLPKKMFAHLILKDIILKNFNEKISLLCFNTIVNIIQILEISLITF